MAEAFAVVGIVASIAQLVELSAEIISRVREYAGKANEVPTTFRSLATQLQLLGITLQQVEVQTRSEQLGEITAKAIKDVIDSILRDIVYLERIFIPVSSSSFDRSLQALKSLAREAKVQDRIERIQANIQLLGFHQNTMQISMGKQVLDRLERSDSEGMLMVARQQSERTNDDSDQVLTQFRNLASSMSRSAYAATKLQDRGRGISESTLSAWLLRITSSWAEYHPMVKFLMTDWTGDSTLDLVAIKKQRTGSGSTEVHIMSGASDYRVPVLQVGTPIEETSDNFDFFIADWDGDSRPDLFAIKKSNTGSHSTEVHILSGESNFQHFALQTGTALHETPDNATFLTTDWVGTGRQDLVFIKKQNTDSKTTEVHILSGGHNFSFFLLQTPTALPETDDSWEFLFTHEFSRTHRADLAAIKRSGSDILEICVLSGGDNFMSFVFRSDAHGRGTRRQGVLQLLGFE